MGFLSRLLHNVDSQKEGITYKGDNFSSIKENIENILNTRVNSSLSSSELGIKDFLGNGLTGFDIHRRLGDEIRKVISVYEPRVDIVDIVCTIDEKTYPWRLSYNVSVCMNNEPSKVYNLVVNFRNNRICKVE